jgi:hypothetical protein
VLRSPFISLAAGRTDMASILPVLPYSPQPRTTTR